MGLALKMFCLHVFVNKRISNAVQKQDTNFRMAIPAEEKLMVTIRIPTASNQSTHSMATSCWRFSLMFWTMSILVEAFPTEQTQVRQDPGATYTMCVGVITNKILTEYNQCQGTFLTQQHMVTSCRCIGSTNNDTGIFTQGSPSSYTVSSWSRGPKESREVANLYFHPYCGIEANTVLLDVGLVEVDSPFSTESVEPASLPDALPFRFYEYIRVLKANHQTCQTTNLLEEAGLMHDAHIQGIPIHKYRTCVDLKRYNCTLIILATNHIFALPNEEIIPTKNPYDPLPPPVYKDCDASAGAPLICHRQMLVGINGRSARCDDPYDSHMFFRMDQAMKWLKNTICE
ncbi:hypothetical protein GE061_013049 [Apolygus lucorum]|uniref:Peptidase S1 domain-containing protein n=1 Tax=Apolygus lucorum TaxID=248454 RepID=A0A8S9XWQ8_APOLU|nr:hypothetical protein GE061_013049 [Apolygus lucorum]